LNLIILIKFRSFVKSFTGGKKRKKRKEKVRGKRGSVPGKSGRRRDGFSCSSSFLPAPPSPGEDERGGSKRKKRGGKETCGGEREKRRGTDPSVFLTPFSSLTHAVRPEKEGERVKKRRKQKRDWEGSYYFGDGGRRCRRASFPFSSFFPSSGQARVRRGKKEGGLEGG